jgi:tRNA threonylcarbamoyladenosine biosynthesis protein TsaB
MIEGILAGAGLGIEDLDGVAVSLGPGSFTGLRIGLALAKGLCFGRGLPLAGVPTLDCLADALVSEEGLILPVKDARRGEVYFSVYEVRAGEAVRLSPYRALAPNLLAEEIRGGSALFHKGRPVVLAGDALARYGDVFRSALGALASLAPEALWEVKPAAVAARGLKIIADGGAADLDTLEPIYVRASEAERQAAAREGHGTHRDQKNDGK